MPRKAKSNRGGYREPKGPRPPGGPGKFSERNEKTQAVKAPGLDDPSMQYGDVQAAQASQRAVPIPNAPRPQARPQNLAPGAGGPAPLPDHIFGMPSSRPEEPVTDGLGIGPGRGPEALNTQPEDPDDRDLLIRYLEKLAYEADSAEAQEVLYEIRNPKPAAAPMMQAPAPVPMAPTPEPEPMEGELEDPFADDADDELVAPAEPAPPSEPIAEEPMEEPVEEEMV